MSCWRHLCGMKTFGRNPFRSLLRVTPEGGCGVWGCLAELGIRSFTRTSPECCLSCFAPDPGIVCLLGVEFHSSRVNPAASQGDREVSAWSSLPRVIRETQRNSVLLCLALLTKLGAIRCSTCLEFGRECQLEPCN